MSSHYLFALSRNSKNAIHMKVIEALRHGAESRVATRKSKI